ncbi:MAG: CapA family protein [Betaproteobacteria bacterium]|nr:CapA family protein [Betaproteobacteria bacterium]MDH3437808.1 CapA family protein [Betaproteobacteria bacterium]
MIGESETRSQAAEGSVRPAHGVTLFLCGDVMTGRGIDQILPHPSKPHLFEPYMRSAQGYVELAEEAHGLIRKPVDYAYIWGDALAELKRAAPQARIINLETSVTAAEDAWPGKGINYRMHPANVLCLTTASIDCCVLANNHVLDWGYAGLRETLAALRAAGIGTAGAGNDEAEATAPGVIDLHGGARALVFAFSLESSGVPADWAARKERSGVSFLADLAPRTADAISERVVAGKRAGDVAIASVHWGGNWGYDIPGEHQVFAHRLIDAGGVDLVHGHSSHHPLAIEAYRGKLILYGCGDFMNDYEGIRGHESFRPDLSLMYFPTIAPASGELLSCALLPMKIRGFRLNRASREDTAWLQRLLSNEGVRFNTRAALGTDGALHLQWD